MKTVLVVENDEWLAENFRRILIKNKYNVIVSKTAESAIKAVDESGPDAVILDIVQNGSNAIGLMHEMQSYSDTGVVPIILCTNLVDELTLEKMQPYGVKKVLNKAMMKPDDIVAAVKSVLL